MVSFGWFSALTLFWSTGLIIGCVCVQYVCADDSSSILFVAQKCTCVRVCACALIIMYSRREILDAKFNLDLKSKHAIEFTICENL